MELNGLTVKHECQQRDCPCESKPKVKAKNKHQKQCLSCELSFVSYSKFERICKRCKLDERFKWS